MTVTWSCTDSRSGVVSATVRQTVGSEGSKIHDRNVHRERRERVARHGDRDQIDETPPDVSATLSRAPDGTGWYNHAPTVTWSATDALSGGVTGDAPQTYTARTSRASLSPQLDRRRGNSADGASR